MDKLHFHEVQDFHVSDWKEFDDFRGVGFETMTITIQREGHPVEINLYRYLNDKGEQKVMLLPDEDPF